MITFIKKTNHPSVALIPLFTIIIIGSIVAFILTFSFKIHLHYRISTKMETWGAYATCLATVISFVALYWVYKTYNSQIKISKEASFDQLFTHLLSNHNAIYQKVVRSESKDPFNEMKKIFIEKSSNKPDFKIEDIRSWYNEEIRNKDFGINLRNYFKYVYYEVSLVAKEDMTTIQKMKYIKLIQSQMNHNELICYLINKVQFQHSDQTQHLINLKESDFFEDLNRNNIRLSYKHEDCFVYRLLELFDEILKTKKDESQKRECTPTSVDDNL